jgi:uncharacterized membrane protein
VLAGEWASTRSAIQTPGVGGEKVKFDSRDIALTAVFAALYAVLVIVQGLSAAATVQLRFADCLIPLSALFGVPVIFGVTLGCFVGNTYTSATMSNGIYDVAFGPIANLIAAALIYLLRNRRLIGCIIGSTVIGFIVGSYIWAIFGAPSNVFGLELPSSWPVWVVSIVSITVSSLVAIAIIGYILLTILSKPTIIEPLKSKGLKVVAEREKAT